ncbi:AGBL2_3 [Mytilus edulis]|uniref:AGBL2_3 n=1 Tax=Mytilus edulis TaxID=6550 RepID=A0A8S3R2A2_MYTED|nr:AGBL2_3 [Mytilus edulis]
MEGPPSDGGSDSSVSDGPPVHLQFQRPFNKKKKKLKSKKERDRVRSSKDDTKTKERPASDQCEKKNLSGHQSSHAKQDKTQSMRYMSNSANKRPKSYEVNGEKTEDQKGKRVLRSHATLSYTALHMGPRSDNPKGPPFTLKCEKSLVAPQFSNEYLEALTNAYLRNGFMNQGESMYIFSFLH